MPIEMKPKIFIHSLRLLIVALFLQSCGPEISFEQPQPAEIKPEQEFKDKYKGKYFGIDDSSYLYIYPSLIVQEWGTLFAYRKSVFDTIKSYSIRNDSIFGSEIEKGVPFKYINDTISFILNYKDTLFAISDHNVLKYYKRQYFLNTNIDVNIWHVRKMYIDEDGYLVIGDLSSKDEIDNLKEITTVKEIKCDTAGRIIRYSANPTKKQFKEFVKKGGFTRINRFVKVKN